MIDWLFTPDLTPARLAFTTSRSSEEFRCLDGLLKGIEIELPEGVTYSDKEGQKRSSIRIKWWITPATGLTYRNYVFPANDVSPEVPIPAEMMQHRPYPRQAPPVIFGHYWLPFVAPHSQLAENVACVDFSVGSEGALAAYRWDGESQAWKPDDQLTRELASLNEGRRSAVDRRTELANEIKSQLKLYFPVALQILDHDITTALAADLLVQWPTLAELQKVSPAKLRKFFYGHNSRQEKKILQRLALIRKPSP